MIKRLLIILRNQKGDTMVEVLMATALLSVVLAGAFTLTNRATRLNQTANERTQVSNLMQREVELLRAYHSDNLEAFWNDFSARNATENSNFCDDTTGAANNRANSYYMVNAGDAEKITGASFTDAASDLFNVWIEPVNGPLNSGYVDFFVYGCWEGIGGEIVQRSGLVMRMAL